MLILTMKLLPKTSLAPLLAIRLVSAAAESGRGDALLPLESGQRGQLSSRTVLREVGSAVSADVYPWQVIQEFELGQCRAARDEHENGCHVFLEQVQRWSEQMFLIVIIVWGRCYNQQHIV